MNQFLLALVVSVLSQTAFSQELEVQKPALQTGSVYHYQSIDLWKNEVDNTTEQTVVEVGQSTAKIQYVSTARGQGILTLDLDHQAMLHSARKGVFEIMRFPIKAGDSWDYKIEYPSTRPGITIALEMSAKFVGWEDVKIPAGVFRTAKIVHRGYWNASDGLRGQREMTYWFSPEVHRIVKERNVLWNARGVLDSQSEIQLTMYRVAPSSVVIGPSKPQ